jgi:hypothetical protein
MAVIRGNTLSTLMEVGAIGATPLHVTAKPVTFTSAGHYRTRFRVAMVVGQSATARIFELRNQGPGVVVLTRLLVSAGQIASGTPQENSFDAYRLTNFTAIDTTSTTSPDVEIKRTSNMQFPESRGTVTTFMGYAQVRGMAAAIGGMTGGTLTKDGNAFATLPFNVAAAINASSDWGPYDFTDDVNGTHPFVFAPNEGFDIENRVANVTSYGVEFRVDCSWAEVPYF